MQIGEVAECTGLSTRTLRFDEDTVLVPPPARSGRTRRGQLAGAEPICRDLDQRGSRHEAAATHPR